MIVAVPEEIPFISISHERLLLVPLDNVQVVGVVVAMLELELESVTTKLETPELLSKLKVT